MAQLMQESPSLLTAVKKMSKEVGAQFSTGFKVKEDNREEKDGERGSAKEEKGEEKYRKRKKV